VERATTVDVAKVESNKQFTDAKEVLFTKDSICEAIAALRDTKETAYSFPASPKDAKKPQLALELCSLRAQLFNAKPDAKTRLSDAAKNSVKQPRFFDTSVMKKELNHPFFKQPKDSLGETTIAGHNKKYKGFLLPV